MKQNAILVVTSLLSILLLTLHITDDIVRGISKAEPSKIALAVLVVLLYGTLVLAQRRSGYVIILLGSLLGLVVPVIHMMGKGVGVATNIGKSSGAFFFVWTHGARRDRVILRQPLGARTMEPATGPVPVTILPAIP